MEHHLWGFNRAVPALVAGLRTIPAGTEELFPCSLEMQMPGAAGQQQVGISARRSLLAMGTWLTMGLWLG